MSTLNDFYYEYHRTGFKKSKLFPRIEATIYQHLDSPHKKELATIMAIAYYCHTDNSGCRWANHRMMEESPEWAFPHITAWVNNLLKKPNKLNKYKHLYNANFGVIL